MDIFVGNVGCYVEEMKFFFEVIKMVEGRMDYDVFIISRILVIFVLGDVLIVLLKFKFVSLGVLFGVFDV